MNERPDKGGPKAAWPREAVERIAALERALEEQLQVDRTLCGRTEPEGGPGIGGSELPPAAASLEDRIRQRTAQLAAVNDALKREVSAHWEAEEQLRVEHAKLELVLACMPTILIQIDADEKVVEWNPAAASALGVPRNDVLGCPLAHCLISWDSSKIDAGLRECRTSGRTVDIPSLRFTQSDGRDGILQVRISPVRSDSQPGSSLLLVGEDVTKQRFLQAQLGQAQKLTAIGELAAGIAHEINTPTQYVGDNTRFLQQAFRELAELLATYEDFVQAVQTGGVSPEAIAAVEKGRADTDVAYLRQEVPAAIDQTLEGVERVTTIVRAMKDFSHPGSSEKAPIDINGAILSTFTVAQSEWKNVATLVTDLDPTLPPVLCVGGEFNQVVLNMVINAVHAISEKPADHGDPRGTITVTTRRDGDWVEIRIKDTGTGIPEGIRDRIFDPFFTTKEVGKGTGQGLALSHQIIVGRHGGSIDLESVMGHGTTFIVRLPLDIAGRSERKAA